MGVSFEDVAAVEVLHRGIIPPTANNPSVDPVLVSQLIAQIASTQWSIFVGWYVKVIVH